MSRQPNNHLSQPCCFTQAVRSIRGVEALIRTDRLRPISAPTMRCAQPLVFEDIAVESTLWPEAGTNHPSAFLYGLLDSLSILPPVDGRSRIRRDYGVPGEGRRNPAGRVRGAGEGRARRAAAPGAPCLHASAAVGAGA